MSDRNPLAKPVKNTLDRKFSWRDNDRPQAEKLPVMSMRARLLTAQSLVHVNSQPFVRQLVTRGISPVVRQAPYFAGKPET